VITPYNPRQTGKERWFIEHETGPTAVYLVEIIPDGSGSAFFEVKRDPGSSAP
jgi:hypothetical protein